MNKHLSPLSHVVFCLAAGLWATSAYAQQMAALSVTRSQHQRLQLDRDIQRVAVGDTNFLEAEPLNSRELLLLGKNSGRTTLLVWLQDGSIREYLCTVRRDIALLQQALARIYPSIEAEIAPDRDAIVLTGTVPDISYLRAAEDAAHNYLDASAASRVLIREEPSAPPQQPGQTQAQAPAQAAQPETIRVPAAVVQATGKVINLIRLERLPPLPEERIELAIHDLGGANVHVRRILKGQIRDDSRDVFVLEGRVPNQVALVRILSVASQTLTGQALDTEDIRVVADESGALAMVTQGAGAGAAAGGAGGGFGGMGGGGGGFGGGGALSHLTNQFRKNIARAKVVEAAGGRILSFLDVADIPQVRVSIQLFEIDRSRLKSYNPSTATLLGTAHVGRLPAPASAASTAVGAGGLGPDPGIQNILGFLGGALTSETQITAGRFALNSVFSYLEQQGVARSLSSPSLTVLSGEQAQFQVGGEIPVPEMFIPTLATTAGVFNSVTFLNYGIALSVKPLVGDDDSLTVDVLPMISTPDTATTVSIRETTGTNLQTTALQTRSLRTSARLQDGQVLLIGGLLSHTTNDTTASTPGLRDIPGLGWLFKNLNRTDDRAELVVVVNPVIVRDPAPKTALWEFPAATELLDRFAGGERPKPDGERQ
jgi:pilus assembly protein CpaC